MTRFYDESFEEVYKELDSSGKGLTNEEARQRLEKFGYNEIKEKKKISKLKIFISQFSSPLIWILLFAVIVSAFLDKTADALAIAAILLLNSILGFVQEYKAERSIEALKKLTSLKAKVIRDGKETEIDAKDLVQGDIIVLETGDKIPADARLIYIAALETQEASLTGESNPVQKTISPLKTETSLADRTNMVFSGTIVTKGRARAIVTATGMSSEIGKIAGLIEETPTEPTYLQKKLGTLAKRLTMVIVILATLIFGAGVLKGIGIEEMFLNAVSLAVAVVPEGLPAVVTITLAIGVQRMIRRHALIRRLPSVETLGSCTVICTDKTGTLTENQMTVRKIFANNKEIEVSGAGYSTEGRFSEEPAKFAMMLDIGVLCNNSSLENSRAIGDPTEVALIVSAAKAGVQKSQAEMDSPRLQEIPFTSERKLMTTIHKADSGTYAYSKGAVEILLKRCSYILINGKEKRITQQDLEIIHRKNEEFARQALRVLAFAYKKLKSKDEKNPESGMVFAGLQAMMDPPRPEAREAISKCRTAGIKVVMITGDHKSTAIAVAKELGIEGKAVTGEELNYINLDNEVEDIAIYARVNPEDKIKIVDALRKKGHVVAMTGDGVNDAPALKKADIGVAMGITGTDVAKESSDMILTDDNFASIVNAVEEGRGVYDNIKKFFAYLISGNIAEILIFTIAILTSLPLPFTAAMILMINLVTDGFPAIALGVDPFEPNAMARKPRNPAEPIYKNMNVYLYYFPILVTAGTLFLFIDSVNSGDSIAKSQTIAFFTIVMFELFLAFSSRSTRYPALKAGIFKNMYLILTVLLSFGITLAVIYLPQLSAIFKTVPLTLAELLRSVSVALGGFAFIEAYKLINAMREKVPKEA